jgi:hypothetical protein
MASKAMPVNVRGPDGGCWVLTRASNPQRCELCGRFVARLWRYFNGAVSHAQLCEACAAKAVA